MAFGTISGCLESHFHPSLKELSCSRIICMYVSVCLVPHARGLLQPRTCTGAMANMSYQTTLTSWENQARAKRARKF